MRKWILALTLCLTLLLSACGPQGLDYSTFRNNRVDNFEELETIEGGKYIAYYYSETCGHCNDVKEEILTFFSTLEDIPFYLLDTSKAQDESMFEDYLGTPTVFIIQDGVIYEKYVGANFVRDFIEKYSDFDLDDLSYDFFDSQHITTYDEALEIQSDAYIIYYYLDNCPHCMRARPDFLKWAWSRRFDEIYFMNGNEIIDPDNIPTELIILNSGTPILVIMSNGEFANEYYSGTDDVLQYTVDTGLGEITTDNLTN